MTPISDPCEEMNSGFWLVDVSSFIFPEIEEKLVRCSPAELANAHDLMPCLIAVEALSVAERECILDMLNEQLAGRHAYAICAWLNCEVDVEQLAEHIGRFLSGRGPEGMRVFWRYFDPRVFSVVIAVFSDAQREALLGPIKNWRFIWCRHWWQVSGAKPGAVLLPDYDAGWPLVEQWRCIVDSSVLSRVLTKLCKEEELTPEGCLQVLGTAISYLADAIQTLGLNDDDDRTEFVYLCTKYGSAYRQHPDLSAGWSLLERGEISWTELRSRFGAADYEHLGASALSHKEIAT